LSDAAGNEIGPGRTNDGPAQKRKKRRRPMSRKMIIILLFVAILVPSGFAMAVTEEDFKVSTTQNLLNLCTVSASDPLAKEAIHFCHGFLIGAYAYYLNDTSGPDSKKLFCMPDPEPSRNEAIAMFLKWSKARPQLMDKPAVEAEFMFLIETWPCKK
jgi:hypothetical protein